jgi:hypothetical protein
MMAREQMADRILAYVRKWDVTTFRELQRLIGDEARGSVRAELEPNLVIWDGASDILLDAVDLRRERKEIKFVKEPNAWYTYFLDGGRLNYPLAGRVPKGGYKRPHWLPIIIRPSRPATPGDRSGPELQRRRDILTNRRPVQARTGF